MFVIDASVTMAWCFEDEADDRTEAVLDRLAREPAGAPGIWRLEVANVLLVAERKSRLTQAKATRFLGLLDQLPIEVDPVSATWADVLAAGRQHSLSAYDAAYLVLAERLDAPLATLDAKLGAACTAAGVPLVIPA